MPDRKSGASIARPRAEAEAEADLPAAAQRRSASVAIAPAWHTLAVVCLMLGVSALGAYVQLPARFRSFGRAPSYLLSMLVEWAAVAFIAWGIRRRGARLSGLIGGSWPGGAQILRDLGIAIAFLVVFGGLQQLLAGLLKVSTPATVRAMLPQTPLEMALWVPLSLTGGFCEEVIFRGYLQRQLSVLSGSMVGGIVLQALIFGLSHGYQGWKMMAIIAVYGACFGWLAHWRASLRPGMLAHALQDGASGLLARLLLH
jgi:CAAX protease family protein